MSMTIHTNTWLVRRKWILVAVGLPVLVALWWAFRPEKLWINEKVNEPAPFDSSAGPQPVLTGRFQDSGQGTSGRATIYKKAAGGEYLRLNDFTTPNSSDDHVVLARSGDRNLTPDTAKSGAASIDLGPLKSNQGDQNYDLPSGTDLNKYNAVVLYGERSHAASATAKLEPF